ncbi:ATP:cob(I)alamin adenosyltransferase [Candidatus Peregrinibacteria bacterium CG11_big_fil_rev_8_21_14_0_20_41_10]|nr:MAG: ATP:cob(I)alamin adenosyltransferase [Candidatus Peregrinibacteria bacterium CG11_big_fil_rev_8_21_14_0_20_41_10]PJC37817.1 MAG: ATP:cob(I)alamin adenosyltransferase [Candidatus Peregrinibacteria bacterium CG_4_9_14_0_2_um_filter_41_14]
MPIYTKIGDQGQSSLYNGDKLPKTNPVFELLGKMDELNATIGICCSLCTQSSLITEWQEIQKKLFAISAKIAKAQQVRNQVLPTDITNLETKIDTYMTKAGPLTSFILPGGSPLGAQLHYTRTIVRTVERTFFQIEEQPPNPAIGPYLNRLSDYFFAVARLVNKEQATEITW